MSTSKQQKAMQSTTRSSRPRALTFLAAAALLALCVTVGHVPPTGAATIATGPMPIDTVIRPDGSAAYILNQGDSSVTVVDTALNQQVNMLFTPVPPGFAQDLDWHDTTQQLHIGCSDGTVWGLDPATGASTLLVNNPGANYVCIAADDRDPGVLGWGIDLTGGVLDQFLVGGAVIPVGPMATGTPVELIEKAIDPAVPGAFDDQLILVDDGGGGTVTLSIYDRVTLAPPATFTWTQVPALVSGVTSSTGAEAYLSATDNATNDGLLLQFNLATLGFTTAPIGLFPNAPATDVAMAGQYVTAYLNDALGVTIRTFDCGIPGTPLDMGGALINPGATAGGGSSAWIGAVGDAQDIYLLGVNQGQDATGEHFGDIKDIWIHVGPGTFTDTDAFPDGTSSLAVLGQEATVCTDAPPQECSGRGGIAASNPNLDAHGMQSPMSVQYSTGEEVKVVHLFSVPGVGIDFDLTLTYRSRIDFDYRYGQGWTLNQDVRLRTEANGDKTYTNGYGRRDVYTFVPGGTYLPPLHYDTTMAVQGQTTTVTNRFGTVSTFNSAGQRTALTDRYGNGLSFVWSGDRLDSVTDTLNRSYTFSYGTDGRLSSVTDFGGRTWTLAYDYLGQLRSITTPTSTQFPQGRTQWFSYSGNHSDPRLKSNLLRVWSPKGDTIQTLVYDANDRVIEETVGGGVYSMSYAVPASNLVTTVVDPVGNTFEWTFDSIGMPLKKEVFTRGLRLNEPTSYVTTYSINPGTGLVDHVVHPRGNRTDFTYDANLNLTEVRRKEANVPGQGATDIVQTWVYGGAHSQPTQYTDPRGNTTVFTVDASGNTTQIDYPTVTSPANQTITETFTFDARGRILTATDGTNRSVSFAYHQTGAQTGYLQTVTRDPGGLALTTTFGYSQYGDVISVTDARSNTVSVTVDAENYVTEVQAPSPLNYRRRIYYDANRSVSSVEVENIDHNGVTDGTTPWIATSFAYDLLGRLIERTAPLTPTTNAVTSYDYDDAGNLIAVVDAEGGRAVYDWDERHLLWKATLGEGSAVEGTVEFAYDENGSLVRTKNARGYETSSVFDLFGRRTQVTNALGHYTTFQYDGASNLTTVEAYDAQATLMARTTRYFDEVDRLWKTMQDRFGPGLTPSYPQTVVTRDAAHRVTQVTDPLSNSTGYLYDMAGRLTRVTDAAGNYRDLTLDANGNATAVSVTEIPASGPSETFVTEHDYDVLNRRIETREIDRLNSQNVLTTSFEYDSRGNLGFRMDAENHPVRWTYDLASRLTKYERAMQVGQTIDDFVLSIEELFSFDANHRLIEITDDNFNATQYQYDARGRRTLTTYADTRYVTYQYDLNSNLEEWTDQNGTRVENTHDALDRLSYRFVTRGAGVLGSTYEVFTYDGLDRMLTAKDDDYQVELTYDSVGNLLKDRQGYHIQGQEQWKAVQTSYTDAGSTSQILYPSGFTVGHTRDGIYRMTAMQDVLAAVNIATFTWQGSGRLATTSNQNGTSTDYAWDGFGRIASIDHQLPTAQTFHRFEYAYDKVHNRRMERNSFDAAWISTLPAQVQTFLNGRNGKGDVYAYDMAYRLVDARYDVTNPLQEVQNPGSQPFVKNVGYTIDGLGNRSQVQTTPPTPPSSVTYAADVVNQYTSVGGVTRTHDQNGNLKDDGTYVYSYDFENRLVQVRQSGTQNLIADYHYDALGRRVEKVLAAGTTTRYVLDGVEVVEEFDAVGTWQARYVYEDGIDLPRCMDRADIADVNGNGNTSEVLRFHYHQQALGSVTEVTQPSGAAVEWIAYDVYGKPAIRSQVGAATGSSVLGNPYLYSGREYDPEVGLYHYRARGYDPLTGRFLQRDPAEYGDGLSLYEYARSMPSVATDPYGLESVLPPPAIKKNPHEMPEEVRGANAEADENGRWKIWTNGAYWWNPNTGAWGTGNGRRWQSLAGQGASPASGPASTPLALPPAPAQVRRKPKQPGIPGLDIDIDRILDGLPLRPFVKNPFAPYTPQPPPAPPASPFPGHSPPPFRPFAKPPKVGVTFPLVGPWQPGVFIEPRLDPPHRWPVGVGIRVEGPWEAGGGLWIDPKGGVHGFGGLKIRFSRSPQGGKVQVPVDGCSSGSDSPGHGRGG